VSSAEFSPDGHRIVTGSQDGTVKVWDAESGASLRVLETRRSNLRVLPSPDGNNILTTLDDASSQLWEAASGRLIFSIEDAFGAAFSPDGTTILTISGFTSSLRDSMTGVEIARLEGHLNRVISAVFSVDGRFIVTASEDNTVRIWEARTGSPLFTLVGHSDMVFSAVFSPDGRFVATASFDHTAWIWDAGNGYPRTVLMHAGPVSAVTFSPDGRYLATASEDGKVRLWTLDGLLDSVFNVAVSGLSSADYSRDGSRLLAVSRDGVADILTLLPSIESLQGLLWKASPTCPDAQMRIHLLGQSKAEAERDYQTCIEKFEERVSG
jgi:WD40 repeat protein